MLRLIFFSTMVHKNKFLIGLNAIELRHGMFSYFYMQQGSKTIVFLIVCMPAGFKHENVVHWLNWCGAQAKIIFLISIMDASSQ